MATQYPENNRHEIEDLRQKIQKLEKMNEDLNISLMRQSAKASEAREQLIRWETELKILADQTGHNLCWAAVARLLKNTINLTGRYPDPENISALEFAHGCVVYHKDVFGSCGVRLKVIETDQE
ncbi:MAG: hypothetical protein Q8Q89_02845 [bacterium]|nr:hypothetical protein [bacterium]